LPFQEVLFVGHYNPLGRQVLLDVGLGLENFLQRFADNFH
jgi:hypothetical protein